MIPGDVVQVIKTDCAKSARLISGMVGDVLGAGYINAPNNPFCDCCGRDYPVESLVHVNLGGREIYAPRPWLKRFPTAEELGIVNETEKAAA